MQPLTREWVEKAEGDYTTLLREVRARKSPNYDAACFHAQQSVEKYLKALLQEHNLPFGRTHDLSVLLDIILPVELALELLRPALRTLTAFAVEIRYPGTKADRPMAMEAFVICRLVRKHLRESLGIAMDRFE